MRYGNIFLFASLQFSGNIEEYFATHSQKLVVFLVQPRLRNKGNLIRVYENGKLRKEEKVQLSENIFLYYLLWQKNYMQALLRYFSKKDKIYVVGFHPLTFFGMNLQKLMRHIEFVYWVGDYFPPSKLSLWMFEKVKKFYHDRIQYTCYLGDGINQVMNGKIVKSFNRKTVMWGVKPKDIKRKIQKNFSILFVGLVKDSQGLESLFTFLKDQKKYSLQIVGVCNAALYKTYSDLIKQYNLSNRVFFPNRFFSDEELNSVSKKSHIGIALYTNDPNNPTNFTDPGKVKAYAEMGLPVIMTNISAIAPFIKKFESGILVSQSSNDLLLAIKKMEKEYTKYIKGLEAFNTYFYFEQYYKEKFGFLEENK